jgi:hypothetical protein
LGVTAPGGVWSTKFSTVGTEYSTMPVHTATTATGVLSRTMSRFTKPVSGASTYTSFTSHYTELTKDFEFFFTKDPVTLANGIGELNGLERAAKTWVETSSFMPGAGGRAGSTNSSDNASGSASGMIAIMYETLE